MSEMSRRNLIRGAAVASAAAAAASVTSAGAASADAATTEAGAAKAAAAASKSGRFGDIRDIKHVLILMQENRSFDMYFGTLKGVIGYGDKAAITLPGGYSVFEQPTSAPGGPVTGTQYPFQLSKGQVTSSPLPPNAEQGAQNANGTDHSWETQHEAWNGGQHNAWYSAKGIETLGYFTREDIPFQYALADAYTIGDAYHCSVLSATGPNRTYLWGGTINADQQNGSYVAYNGGDELGDFLPWQSYPVALQTAGLTWKIYQGSDNYGDNGAQYYKTFAELDPSQGGTAAPGNPYYDNGLTTVPEPLNYETYNGDNLANAIKADVEAGTLPQVGWVVTNQQYSEHPDGAPTDGAYYVGRVLQALAADPEVLNSTLVIIDYDENDGAFDHVPPPVAPPGTTDEFYLESSLAPNPLPVGLGYRVPLFLISPWTRGGWVTSEVCDHTSVLQFLEKWTTAIGKPAICPNISEWRRSVSGDLTNALDFTRPVYGLPDLPWVSAPVGEANSYEIVPTTNELPVQEPGWKPARPLPYQANAILTGFTKNSDGTVTADLALSNSAPHVSKSSHFHVRDNLQASQTLAAYPNADLFPGQYTVAGSKKLSATTPAAVNVGAPGAYDITVVSANRFLRRFTGDLTKAGAAASVSAAYYEGGFELAPTLILELANHGRSDLTYTITHTQYSAERPKSYKVRPGLPERIVIDPLAASSGWYDLTITIDGDSTWSQRYTGHLETGEPSITGAA
ncbi:MAG TPA: phospholipase C, phosphocholine-specific [Trebonia sp.]|jgi:phospholipase C|nr:phospholipase C, phosphocholine-specific [Trebonia sp.]